MRLQFEPAGGNKWGSKQWRNSYATHFLFQVLTHYFSFWSLKFISNFQTGKQTACLQKNVDAKHLQPTMSILRGGDGGHCSRRHCTVRAYPLLRVILNPLLRVISTLCWEWHHFESLNCQLSWEDFQRHASGNHGKERRGLNKGEIRKKNERRK